MTDIVGGLVKRRAELSGEAETLRTRLTQIGTDIGHLDAVIRQFDPDHDVAGIRPKRPRRSDAAGRGEMSRYVLGVLRDASGPLMTTDIAQRFIADRGIDAADPKAVRSATKRIGMTLGHQRDKGTVRSQPGPGNVVVWEISSGL